MKVYFTASARGEKEYGKFHKQIFECIKQHKHQHLSNYAEENNPGKIYSSQHQQKVALYNRTIKDIKKADVVILEVSTHSLSMGYVMNYALNLHKPVVLLHLENKQPIFALGITNDLLQIIEYTPNNLETVVLSALKFAFDNQKVRFNMFLSAELSAYLNRVAKKEHLPKSVFIRNLLKNHKKTHKE